MWPLLLRELRLEARRPFNRRLRLASALFFFLILMVALESPSGVVEVGRRLFPILHSLLLALPWVVAPVLTAEVIGRERRSGMLEQLQLTRVTWGAIVRSITLGVTARTLTLMVASFPVLMVTVLFGGVGRVELQLAALLQGISIALALSVGLLAAALGRTWARAMGWAGVLGVMMGGGVAWILYVAFQRSFGAVFAPALWPPPESIRSGLSGLLRWIADGGGTWGPTLAAIPGPWINAGLELLVAVLAAGIALHVLCGWIAEWALRLSLRDSGVRSPVVASRGKPWLPGRVSPEVRRRWLRGNPVRWLMRYPRETRWVRLVAAIAVFGLETVLSFLRIPFEGWFLTQAIVAVLLGAALALVAASSFRVERETGAMELLLVTPLRPGDLGRGRIGGLWWMFGPAYLVWAGALWVSVPILRTGDEHIALVGWGLALFATVPAVGLEAAFQFRGYWRAASTVLGLTLGLSGMLFWLGVSDEAVFWVTGLDGLILFVLAALSLPGFERRFTQRRNGEPPGAFPFRPPATHSPYSPLVRRPPPPPVSRFQHRP